MKQIYLMYPKKIGIIAPEIYGHFSEQIGGVFYDGLWVGKDSKIPNIQGFRKDLIEKLRKIHPAVLRWPGGCFAETYDWRDGIGENRPTKISWWTRYDQRYESNEVGTHEFLTLCELIGAKAYLAANITGVTPLHIRDWMDYCLSPRGSTALAKEREKNGRPEPFKVPYWGVGNENWGGGGDMRAEDYAVEYRKFSVVMHNVDTQAELFACGTDGPRFDWTHGVMPILASSGKHINGYAMHYYCGKSGDCVNFDEQDWDRLISQADQMEEIIERNWHIICGYDMQERCKLVVDEWGCWHPEGSGPSKGYNLFEQQSTMRDAMVAAHTLNIFNRHCDKVKMANVAQLTNNLHALFLAGGEHCIVTPTYHVFDLYQEHQGAEAIDTVVTDNETLANALSVSASYKDGKTLITIGNLSCREDAEICLQSVGRKLPAAGTAKVLAGSDMHAHNTFEDPDAVEPIVYEFDPTEPIVIPKAGVVALRF